MCAEALLEVIGPKRMGYREAFEEQLRLRDACIESGGRRNFLMLLEHPPTITIGRGGGEGDVLASPERLARLGVELVRTNRGGEVTFHGPGQLVAYPIVDLRRRGRDLHRYLRDLEAWLVELCRTYGIEARGGSPQTGVWVRERKLASIGIAVRRWVSYHGAALNVSVDLSRFELIVPCGMPQVEMTSLERELGLAPPMAEVAGRAAELFAGRFGLEAASRAAASAERR